MISEKKMRVEAKKEATLIHTHAYDYYFIQCTMHVRSGSITRTIAFCLCCCASSSDSIFIQIAKKAHQTFFCLQWHGVHNLWRTRKKAMLTPNMHQTVLVKRIIYAVSFCQAQFFICILYISFSHVSFSYSRNEWFLLFYAPSQQCDR